MSGELATYRLLTSRGTIYRPVFCDGGVCSSADHGPVGCLTITSSAGVLNIALSGYGVLSGSYQIVNRLTGKVLDVAGSSGSAGALVQENSANGSSEQGWTFSGVAGGYHSITNTGSGKALDVVGASTAPGAPVQQYDYQGGANQQWELAPIDDVHYKIGNRLSGMVLDVTGGSTANGNADPAVLRRRVAAAGLGAGCANAE